MNGFLYLLFHIITNPTLFIAEPKATLPGDKLTVVIYDNSHNKTSLRVQIQEILPNGTYLITGEERIVIRGETQKTRYSGIVRPEDITIKNTVQASLVTEAHYRYS